MHIFYLTDPQLVDILAVPNCLLLPTRLQSTLISLEVCENIPVGKKKKKPLKAESLGQNVCAFKI